MSDSRIVDTRTVYKNDSAKIERKIHIHEDGAFTLQTVIDETKKFDDNKALHNMTSSLDRWGDGKVCLRGVPFELIEKWKKMGWFTKENFWRALSSEEAKPYKVFGK